VYTLGIRSATLRGIEQPLRVERWRVTLRRRVAVVLSVVVLVVSCVVGVAKPAGASTVVLDPYWGGAGVVAVGGEVFAAGVQGRVFLADRATGGVSVRRLGNDGALDLGWGGDGEVVVSLPSPGDEYVPMAVLGLQSGGALVLVSEYSGSGVLLIRLLADGSLDATGFGVGGVASVASPGSGAFDSFLTLGATGEIFLSTHALLCQGGPCTFSGFIGRLTSSGALDSGFDGDGWLAVAGYAPTVVGVRSDGKVIVHEDSSTSVVSGRVRRLMPNGAPDLTFPVVNVAFGVRVFRPSDGRLMVVRQAYVFNFQLGVLRWEATLSYFTSGGAADVSRPNQVLAGTDVVQPLGQLDDLVVGPSGALYFVRRQPDTGEVEPASVGRLTSSGKLDSSFGVNGFGSLPGGLAVERGLSAAINDRGQPMVAYETWSGGVVPRLVRFKQRDATALVDPPSHRFGRRGAGQVQVADPVDTATGNLTDVESDLPGEAFGLSVVRSYNGRSTVVSSAGARWRVAAGSVLAADGDVLVVSLPDGTPLRFAPDGSGGFLTPVGSSDVLSVDPAGPSGGGSQAMLRVTHIDGGVDRFDTAGRLIEQRSWDGQSAVSVYDGVGRLWSVTSSSGPSLLFSYGSNGLLSGVSTSSGRSVAYGYDSNFLLSSVTDEFGGTSTVTYTSQGLLATMVDPSGVVLEANVYDDQARVVAQTAPNGGVTSFVYLDSEAVTEVTHSLTGEVVQYHHDEHGKVIAITDPFGVSTERFYDGQGNLTGATSRNDSESSATFDANDNVLSTTQPGVGTSSYVYDGVNRLVSSSDPWGATTTYAYEADERAPSAVTDALAHTTTYDVVNGLTMSTTDADGVTTSYTYDALRRMLTSVDGVGNVTHFAYDAQGRRVSTTSPTGRLTTWSYLPNGRLGSTTAADGGVTSYTYDLAGRVLTVTDPVGAVTTNTYNGAGGLASTSDPAGRVTSYAYDTNGQVTAVTAPGGAVSGTSYGELNRVLSTSDPLARSTSYEYNTEGQTTQVTDPASAVSATNYDDAGRVASTVDAVGRVTTTNYDAHGRVASSDTPAGSTSYVYDVLGRTSAVTDQRGGVTTTTYTPGGRVATVTDPTGLTTTYGYDLAGRRKTVTAPGGRITTTAFTTESQPLTVTSPGGLTVGYTYDTVGRTLTSTDPGGVVTTKTYTLRGEMHTDKTGAQGTVSYVYNLNGTLATVTDALGRTTTFGYDVRGNLTSRTNALGGVDTWAYDTANQLLSSTDPLGRASNFEYDAAGRISIATDPSGLVAENTYNPDGTLQTRTTGLGVTTYTYDPAGRVTSIDGPDGASLYGYTAAGDVASVANNDAVTTYGYDTAGRRTRMGFPDGNTINYTYNPAGQLASIKPGELSADSFTQLDGQTPVTTKWTPTAVAGATATVGSNAMRLVVADAATSSITETSKVAAAPDHDVTLTYQFASSTPATSSKLTLFAKYTIANQYRVEINSDTTTATVIRKIGTSTTTLGTVPIPLTTEPTRIRFQIVGTTVKVKIWPAADAEPATWTGTYTASPAVTTAGTVRVALARTLGANAVTVDDWSQTNPTIAPAAVATYTYNLDGQVTNEALRGGTRTRVYTAGRMTGYTQTVPGLTRSTTLGYDTTGRIITDNTASVTTTYGYDAGSQLISATPSTGSATVWTYDALGRRSSEKVGTAAAVRYVYDPAGQLCWTTTKTLPANPACAAPLTGATTFTWDDAGRMLNQTVTATNKIDISYDNIGRPATTVRMNGATTTTHTRSYRPDGLLAGINNTVVTATATTVTTSGIEWDTTSGLPQPSSIIGTTGIATDLTRGPGGWASAQTGLTISPAGADAYGSAVPTTGTTTLARNTTYTPYGTPAGTNTFEIRLGYRGEITLDNQLYLRARNYQPTTGRFTTRDPMSGVSGTTTLADAYHYSNNTPLMMADPTGLTAIGDPDLDGGITVTITGQNGAIRCSGAGCEYSNIPGTEINESDWWQATKALAVGVVPKSVGGCGSFAGGLAIFSAQFGGCFLYDGDRVAVLGFAGGGAQLGAALRGSTGNILSNADDYTQILGGSVCGGFSGVYGFGVSGELCFSLNGQRDAFSGYWTLYAALDVGAALEGHLHYLETRKLLTIDVPCARIPVHIGPYRIYTQSIGCG